MSLLRLQNICVSFGDAALLDNVELKLDPGERVCLVGRNGQGKSTLLRVLHGDIQVDSGEIIRRQGLRVAQLEQDVPKDIAGTIGDLVRLALGEAGELLAAYNRVASSGENLDLLDGLQTRIDALDGWQCEQRIASVLSTLKLDGDIRFESLSGGLKRRALLARALVCQPDILLLDEPTNHLDIESIEWLEKFLHNYAGTLLFITHDRAFLRRLATRIIEIDRGQLTSWPGDYDRFLVNKQAFLDAESKQRAEFDKKLAREEVWIRQGIKARRTRNEGRVRALEKLRAERSQRRERIGNASIRAQQGGQSGKIVIEAKGLNYAIDGKSLVTDFSATISRGDKIGIIGPNGAGKTTLIKLLLGQLPSEGGKLKLGSNIELAYFDQLRAQLNPNQTAQENVSGDSETVVIDGKPMHIISYLQDFLFSPQRARAPIKMLSGGEKNRLLLAKLFTQPSNVLVMDEPTNDLDIETLELLEEQLLNYSGTLLLVSHDRAFIDNIVTSTLVLEGEGRIGEYVGGFTDWLRQRAVADQSAPKSAKPKVAQPATQQKKTSYKAQRELENCQKKIEQLEAEQAELAHTMSLPDFYQQAPDTMQAAQTRYKALEQAVAEAYERWEALA